MDELTQEQAIKLYRLHFRGLRTAKLFEVHGNEVTYRACNKHICIYVTESFICEINVHRDEPIQLTGILKMRKKYQVSVDNRINARFGEIWQTCRCR